MDDEYVHLVDYIIDPLEEDGLTSWGGITGLIEKGAEEKFGEGTTDFLREAFKRQDYMKIEILQRYGLH